MDIPIEKRLRKRAHVELAKLQDEVVDVYYQACPGKPVLHGGTAIWRCYGGFRFSEDLDFYGSVDAGFEAALRSALEARGLSLERYKKAPHVAYAKVSNGYSTVKLEITEAEGKKPVLKKYRKADGIEMDILTLSPEDLIQEKMAAYLGRKLIRDIYDVYYLSGFVEGKIPGLKEFLAGMPGPLDEENLKTLLYSGVAPSFREMADVLKGRSK